MNRYKTKKGNAAVKAISYMVIFLLFVALTGALLYLFVRPQGIYIRHGDKLIADSSASIELFEYGDIETFEINNSKGWGAYSVEDCTINILPSVDSVHDFEFSVSGKKQNFGSIKDLSPAFSFEGNSVRVGSDGVFRLRFKHKNMVAIIQSVYGESVELSSEVDISAYPYFLIQIVSPDGKTAQTINFKCAQECSVNGITLDKTEVVF